MGYKLALDFGMTNSVVAQWDEDSAQGRTLEVKPLSVSTSGGSFLIPTLLYVQDGRTGEFVMGQSVRDQELHHRPDNRLFRNFKRTIKTEAVFDARIIDGVPWTDGQAGKTFLRHLLASLPYHAEDIDQLVITAPVAAFDEYTAWLNRVLENIPVEKIRIVDESTAAALGYAVTKPGAIVLVIDFGGGTLDLSLVRLPEYREKLGSTLSAKINSPVSANAQVIAKAGISLGGSDIDQWLLQEVLRRTNLSRASLGPGYSSLLSACERAKIDLSTTYETSLHLVHDVGQQTSIVITRADFELLLHQNGLFMVLRRVLEKVMGLAAQKGVYREDIQHILLVGGTSLIPSIQQTLDGYFRDITQRQRKAIMQMPDWPATTWKIDNTSIRVDKPFTAVVEGALRIAAGFHLNDQLAHGYGLRYLDSTGTHRFDEIIPMSSTYPSRTSVNIVLGASHPGQKFIEFLIGQINTDTLPSIEVNLVERQRTYITQAGTNTQEITILNAGHPVLVKLSPPGQPGQARLRAEFRVDSLRRLRVSVLDLRTRNKILVDALVTVLGSSGEIFDPDLNVGEASGNEPALIKFKKNKLQSFIQAFTSLIKYAVPERVAVDAFLADLRSDDTLKRFDAADTLARRGDRDARLAFEDILEHGTPPQRASAARHLYHFSWFTAEPLFHKSLIDEDQRVREAAMFALCKMRIPQAYSLAANVLQDSSDAMRLSAVWGIHNHPDPAALPILSQTLRAQNPEIRTLALEDLGATATPEAIAIVKSAISDADPEVQYAATLSWVELAREACFSELAEQINETRGWSRRWILRAFFHATNYMGIETGASPGVDLLLQALENALKDDLPEARLAAFLPLAWIRHPHVETVLIAGYRNEIHSDTKAHMLTAAVHLMSPAANILLQDAERDKDPLLRQTAEFLKYG